MIDEATLDDLLGKWGSWVVRQNRQKSLGIKISGYAERIGGGSYGEAPDTVGPDVLELDEKIKRLPDVIAAILFTHYGDPDPVKRKASNRGQSRDGYYGSLKTAKLVLIEAYSHDAVS